ncbi:MAG: T9SS type A sorting domain-containing protein, partial [Bacteroidota bacterium]
DIAVSPSNRKVRLATHGKGVFERDMLPVNITGLPSFGPADWSLMPNPATEYFIFECSSASKIQLRVFNAKAQQVWSQTVVKGATRISVGDWTAGIYFVEATVDGKSSVKKLLVR